MVKRQVSQREQALFIVCIGAIAIYVGYQFVFKALRSRLESLDRTIAAAERRLETQINILRQETMVTRHYDQRVSSRAQQSSDENEMASIVSEIGSVAAVVNLRVADLKPQRVRKVDFYNEFSVSLAVDGELLTILEFLHALQGDPHRFSIDEINLDKGSARTAEIRCRLVASKILIPQL